MTSVQLLVACPYCLAGPGEACKPVSRNDGAGPLAYVHIERTREALR